MECRQKEGFLGDSCPLSRRVHMNINCQRMKFLLAEGETMGGPSKSKDVSTHAMQNRMT
jgi:hypothetical protein